MAFVQLDQAARQVGKSEVTVRRLIKAGKISHRKEKTLTGFIYLVDPSEISRYYGDRGSSAEDFAQHMRESGAEVIEEVRIHRGDAPADQAESEQETGATRQIRVAVAGESGNLSEYWQKRAETYENRYHQALESQSKLREELGAWRGRAEQAQNMLIKLLPAPTPTPAPTQAPVPAPEEPKQAPGEVGAKEKTQTSGNTWVVALLAVIAGLFVVALAAGFYVLSR